MKDRDVDTHLKQYLLGDPPREAFKQQVLRDSTAEFLRIRQRCFAWYKVGLAVAAMLIIGMAFLAGRLSAPYPLPGNGNSVPLADSGSNSVAVSEELIAWLDAARLFGQLGMDKRMARAVERAGKLLPADTVFVDSPAGQMFAATRSVENQNTFTKSMDLLGPHPSAENVSQVLAISFGD